MNAKKVLSDTNILNTREAYGIMDAQNEGW